MPDKVYHEHTTTRGTPPKEKRPKASWVRCASGRRRRGRAAAWAAAGPGDRVKEAQAARSARRRETCGERRVLFILPSAREKVQLASSSSVSRTLSKPGASFSTAPPSPVDSSCAEESRSSSTELSSRPLALARVNRPSWGGRTAQDCRKATRLFHVQRAHPRTLPPLRPLYAPRASGSASLSPAGS